MTSRRFIAPFRARRRGMALVLVLGLLVLTLGLSYALLRTNTVDHELQRNSSRKGDARAAAQTGMSIALRKLYDGTWNGAGTSFASTLDTDGLLGFEASYVTGDSDLTSASADWSEYPFRITVESTGYATDPNTAASRSEYTIRAVAQLVRRQLNTNTVAVTGLESFSISQSSSSDVRIHHPVRINGNFHLQGELEFSTSYPRLHRGTEYMKFFDHIYDMYSNHGWDYRPFNGRLYTPSSRQPITGDVAAVLEGELGVQRTSVPTSSATLVPTITSFNGYQLFDKGKVYPGAAIPVQLDTQDVVAEAEYLITPGTYAADPEHNPLGIYYCKTGSLGVTSNTTVQGVLLDFGSGSGSDIHIAGQNVLLQGKVLPALLGDVTNYRMPVVIAGDDVRVHDGSSRNVDGWIVCGDEFQLKPGASSSAITVTGGVFCSKLYLDERTGWTQNGPAWESAYNTWNNTLLKLGQNVYFPGWLANNRSTWGIYLTPRLIFNPTPNGVKNHVPDCEDPIYVGHPDDANLLIWDLISWREIGS